METDSPPTEYRLNRVSIIAPIMLTVLLAVTGYAVLFGFTSDPSAVHAGIVTAVAAFFAFTAVGAYTARKTTSGTRQ